MQQSHYNIIGLGGTFDHFHAGHRHFLSFAADLAEEVWVGITTPEVTLKKQFSDQIEPYEKREKAVKEFLVSQNIKYRLFPLPDVYGPTLEGSPVEAIAVTEATQRGGALINQERKRLGLPTLPVHVCNLLTDEECELLSSTRIREGKVNRAGQVYELLFVEDLHLNDNQRKFFNDKQGKLVSEPTLDGNRYVVGDMVLDTFVKEGWEFKVGIFDGLNQRSGYSSSFLDKLSIDIEVNNPQHVITTQLIVELKKVIKATKSILRINGEEDLAAVALALLLPLGDVVYYGQPNEGMIEMEVTEELKEKFFSVFVENRAK